MTQATKLGISDLDHNPVPGFKLANVDSEKWRFDPPCYFTSQLNDLDFFLRGQRKRLNIPVEAIG